MTLKRGQIAIFFLLGVIFLIGFGFIYFVNDSDTKIDNDVKSAQKLNLDIVPVYNYFNDCFRQKSEEALTIFGMQGGNIQISYDGQNLGFNITNFYENGNNVMPELSALEDEFSILAEIFVESCMLNETFLGFDIKALQEPIITTRFTKQSVFLNVNYPLELSNPNRKALIQNFNINLPVRFKEIYDIAEKIVEREVENPGRVDYSFLSKFNASISVLPFDENHLFYMITDHNSRINLDEDYNFIFSNEFDFEEEA